jgi:hypothetical protein
MKEVVMSNNRYLELLSCSNPNEVYQKAQEFSSERSEKEHLIRSIILDIHANVEMRLKQVLYQHMLGILFQDENETENKKRKKSLEKTLTRLSFMDVYRLLKPCLDAFPAPDFASIEHINNVRNQVAHAGLMEKVTYNGRNPYKNPDSFAELCVDSWTVCHELGHFYEVMIGDPRAIAEHHAKFYIEHYKDYS